MYERVKKVIQAWSPKVLETVELDSIENMRDEIVLWDDSNGTVSYGAEHPSVYSNRFSFQTPISSALLLYRLCCLFPCEVKTYGPEGYKRVWFVKLRHKETDNIIGFTEHKAAIKFYAKKLPLTGSATFDHDWLSLVNLLLHPQCPHPYDGTVAGSVA